MSGRRDETPKRGILYYLGLGLSAGVLAFVMLIGALVIVIPAFTGSIPMTILTSSMEPTYPPGTLVIVRPTDPAEVRIGDALTYQIKSGEAAVVTHRVIAIENNSNGEISYTTQGDNNGLPDELAVRPVQIKGTVWYSLPWIGHVNTLINGDARAWVVPLLATALLLYAGYAFTSAVVTSIRRRRNRPDDAEAPAAG